MDSIALIVHSLLSWRARSASPPEASPMLLLWQEEQTYKALGERIRIVHQLKRAPRVRRLSLAPLGDESSNGFFSDTSRVFLTYRSVENSRKYSRGQLPSTLIMKTEGSYNAHFARAAAQVKASEREYLFYMHIRPLLVRDVRTPIVYECSPSCILMEDLSPTARLLDQEKGASLASSEKALATVANLHAKFWQGHMDSKTAATVDALVVSGEGSRGWLSMVKSRHCHVWTRLGFFGMGGTENDEKAIGSFLFDNADAILRRITTGRNATIIHGDYRAGNLMMTKDEGECVVLDWQTYCVGLGLYDVAGIVVGSMTVPDSRKHCLSLLRGYQRRLAALGIDYPWEDLWTDFRVCILAQGFLVNYILEGCVDETGLMKGGTPPLFEKFCNRIVDAILRYDCMDETLFDA